MATAKKNTVTIAKAGDPNSYFDVVTSKGRKMACRDLGIMEEFRLNSILGASDSTNPTTSIHAQSACVVRQIDAVPYLFPENRLQLEAAIERLGRDGLSAVAPELISRQDIPDVDADLTEAGNDHATQD
jgi:hypothetical protein